MDHEDIVTHGKRHINGMTATEYIKKSSRVVVLYTFNPSIQEAEAGRLL